MPKRKRVPVVRTVGTPVGVAPPNRHKPAGVWQAHEDRWIDPRKPDPPPPPPGVKAFGSVFASTDNSADKTKRLQLWIPWEAHGRLKAFCAKRDYAMNSWVTALVLRELDRLEPK